MAAYPAMLPVAADQRYYDKAAHLSNIIRLKDLPA